MVTIEMMNENEKKNETLCQVLQILLSCLGEIVLGVLVLIFLTAPPPPKKKKYSDMYDVAPLSISSIMSALFPMAA